MRCSSSAASYAAAEGLDRVLELIVEGSAGIAGASHASLWLQEPGSGDVVARAAVGYEDGAEVVGRRAAAAAVAGLTTRLGPYFVGPGEAAVFLDAAPTAGTHAVAPLSVDGRWGAIVATPADGSFGERELELLGGVAHQAKLAIANASSFESLERTFLSTVEALANALEARDEYTSSHARWITDTALRVGGELGLDGETLKRLELGALFHDIGKIGMPELDPAQAGAARRRRARADRDAPRRSARRSWRRSTSSATSARSCVRATSAGTAPATPTGSRARRSRSRPGSSSRATPTTQ